MFPNYSHVMLRLSIKNKREFHGTLRIEKNNGIVTVYLNRPDKRNAMSFALLKELVSTAKAIKRIEIRCVILTGEAQVLVPELIYLT